MIEIKDLVLHEDDDFFIINKPTGILSQDDSTSDKSIWSLAEEYLGVKLHLLSRLDRPVSGICTFRKNPTEIPIEILKKYLAIVPKGKDKQGKLEHYLRRDGKLKKASISKSARPGFKKCWLEYRTILELDHVDIIEVILEAGRFHQIRAQLSAVGKPIRGDVKYGARRGNRDRGIDLHAFAIHIPSVELEIMASSNRDTPLWNRIDQEIISKK